MQTRSPLARPSPASPAARASTRSRSWRKVHWRSPWMTAGLPPWSLPDDVLLHGAERAQQLLLGRGLDVVLVERLDEILDGGVPLVLGDAHVLVGRLHVLAGVGARTAGRLADLVRQ